MTWQVPRLSLRTRLAVMFTLLVGVIIVGVGAVTYQLLREPGGQQQPRRCVVNGIDQNGHGVGHARPPACRSGCRY